MWVMLFRLMLCLFRLMLFLPVVGDAFSSDAFRAMFFVVVLIGDAFSIDVFSSDAVSCCSG